MGYHGTAEQYLKTYPKLNKWINECSVCHTKGYKPDMPEHIGGEDSVAANNIKRYFQPLKLNDDGVCLQCARLLK